MSTKPLILIAAGGTGGHVFPALAVAHELLARGFEVEWVGAPRGIENRLVPANNIALNLINVSGLRGTGLKRVLIAPWMLCKALYQALAIVHRLKPAAVLGMGGFAAGPGCAAARLLGVPVIVHEQNAIPGLTNKILARIATKILEGFDSAFATKGIKGAIFTGNPVRKIIAELPPRDAHTPPLRVLVIGGSLGAEALNELVPQAVAQIPVSLRPSIWHQCGSGRRAQVFDAYNSRQLEATVEDFIDDMAAAYMWADLIVCRAGAMTVAEVAVAGLPAIFVPFPFAVDDHQTANADWLAQQGGALVLAQDTLSPELLAKTLVTLFESPAQISAMATASRAAAKPDATRRVADICEEYARG